MLTSRHALERKKYHCGGHSWWGGFFKKQQKKWVKAVFLLGCYGYISTELGIRLSFVKTSEFRGGGGGLNTQTPLGTPLVHIYRMYIQYGLWTGLMSARWAETCRQIYRLTVKLFVVFRPNIIIFTWYLSNILGSSVWNLLYVTLLVPTIMRLLVYLWKICCTTGIGHRMYSAKWDEHIAMKQR
jgi:hypothetical protein